MADDLKLSKLDRIFLVNQLRVLEALYPDEASSLSVQREALERGYEMLYAWDTEFIYDGDDVMSAEESREVWDTMDMFDAINRSLPDGFDISRYPVLKFAGYDGNNESKFLAFAQFTVERLQRFEYLPMQKPGYWNSHMPIRPVYGRMLDEWRKVDQTRRFELNSGELERILGAAIHPERR
ncbi:YfbU family protein [Agrobacterium radiobacter]|uniref:YfbU family protein n=1 Tax=Agrobacterium radiobacter TaxID=362 RepID=UPI000761D0A4|nr:MULTISPECIES: YfbU family protein [Agrobacterium tumefaciens complex]KAB0459776.1 YfbU family protein [Agrobacterium tumefaciens]KWT77089.1 hypothetical protein ASH09_12170 [Agrobacterium radiobacter]NIB11116.1 YfbU family protein [Agrobacterium radiobacter]OOO38258.1 hypothetical protein BS628_08885 [Agrobacterium radiobacter]